MEWQLWVSLVVQLVVVFLIALGVYAAARTVWREFVIPFRDRFFVRVDLFYARLEEALAEVRSAQSRQAQDSVRQEDVLWRVEGDVQQLLETREACTTPTGTYSWGGDRGVSSSAARARHLGSPP